MLQNNLQNIKVKHLEPICHNTVITDQRQYSQIQIYLNIYERIQFFPTPSVEVTSIGSVRSYSSIGLSAYNPPKPPRFFTIL